jgi:hypothetical protein
MITGTLLPDGYTRFSLSALTPYGVLAIDPMPLGASTSNGIATPEPQAAALILLGIVCLAAARLPARDRRLYCPGGTETT